MLGIQKSTTFSVTEAAAVCRVSVGRIHRMVQAKVFRPVVVGHIGAGKGHRLSGQQMYALAICGALYHSPRGCRNHYAAEVFDTMEDLSDAGLEEFRGGVTAAAEIDDHSEEAICSWIGKLDVSGVFRDEHQPTTSDKKVVADMAERMERVDQAIRLRKQERPIKGRFASDKVSEILR